MFHPSPYGTIHDKGWFKWEAKKDFFTKAHFLSDSFSLLTSPRCLGPPSWGDSTGASPEQLSGAGAVRGLRVPFNPLSVGLSFWFGRFDTWLSSHLKLPPSSLLSYSGNYTDDAKSWRLVDITRLTTKYQHDRADKHICTSLLKTKTCSLERALRRTQRFQKWLRAKRLTPDLVQVCPGLQCPAKAGGARAERVPCGLGG